MALRNVLIEASPDEVWAVLADGHSYAQWVVGTQEVCAVDDDWPREGASLTYIAGFGPLRVEDRTFVRISEPPRRLELEARLRMMAARVSILVEPWGSGALVLLDEHPLRGSSLLFENPVVEFFLTLRNRLMVRRLADAVERRYAKDHAGDSP